MIFGKRVYLFCYFFENFDEVFEVIVSFLCIVFFCFLFTISVFPLFLTIFEKVVFFHLFFNNHLFLTIFENRTVKQMRMECMWILEKSFETFWKKGEQDTPFSEIFQKRYNELPILEVFLMGASNKITYFPQVFPIRGVSYRALSLY